ncbi:MAG: hypothetical protein JWR16_3352 [Nevskia sp.]|nr:hypothetical protein [Nevskia sp.]
MKRRLPRILLALSLAAAPTLLWAAAASSTASTAAKATGDSGTTIVGDQDAAVGLYLTPWKDESAADTDRAPGLLDQKPAPFNPVAFKQQIENDDALAAFRRAHMEQNR